MKSAQEIRELLEIYIKSEFEPIRMMCFRMDIDQATVASFRRNSKKTSIRTIMRMYNYLKDRVKDGNN